MTEIHIYGPTAMLKNFPDRVMTAVDLVTSYKVQGYQFSKAFRKGKWDGRKRLFRKRTGAFPTGLVPAVQQALEELGESVEVVDHRNAPTPTEGGFELQGVTFDYPYDYQLDACKQMVEKKQGIVDIATNGGKTEIAGAVTQYLGLKTLFIVTSVELLYQARERFKKRLGKTDAEIGIVGDGVWEPGTWVTIASLPTLESRRNTPECMALLKDADVMFIDECVALDSIITTKDGYCLAKDVVEGTLVATDRGYKPVTYISRHVDAGVKIKLEHGGFLECANTHPVAAWSVDAGVHYVYADMLAVGDLVLEAAVACPDTDWCIKRYIQGVFAGDGHWHTPNKIRWSYRKDCEWWEGTFSSLLKSAYPDVSIQTSINTRGDHILTVSSPALLLDLSRMGFSCHQTKACELPFPSTGIAAYIGGLYDTEGWIDAKGRIHFSCTAKSVMQVCQRFLRDANIDARLVEIKSTNKKHNDSWRITVPAQHRDLFLALTKPKLPRKQKSSVASLRKTSKGENLFSRQLLSRFATLGLYRPTLSKLSGVNLSSKRLDMKTTLGLCSHIKANLDQYVEAISLHSAAKILKVDASNLYKRGLTEEDCAVIKASLLNLLTQSVDPLVEKRTLCPRAVTAIEPIEVLPTVEFEVADDHTFVANGVLTHNCHHTGSETWYTITTLCNAYYRFGLSGTPLDRTDGANLRLVAATGDVIVSVRNKFLVERGVSAQGHVIFDSVTEPILKKGIRYPTAYKQGVVENPQMLQKVIDWTKVFNEVGLGCLILVEEIQHGRLIDDALWTNTDGVFIPHQFIYGDEDSDTRKKALTDFANGTLPVLLASSILDEGVDVPTIDALIVAGSRKSRIRTMQRLGRGLRGKKLIVIEFANYTNKYLSNHSLQRLKDYREEDCFPIYNSGPDVDLVRKIWEGDDGS